MRLRSSVLCLIATLSAGSALAQTPPATGPAPSGAEAGMPAPPEAAPVTITPADKGAPPAAQADSQKQAPAPSAPAPAASAGPAPAAAADARPALVPSQGDPTGVEDVVLPAKPAAILTGTSNWEEAFDNLKGAFAKIEDALKKAGIAPAGKRLTVFLSTDDKGFRYKAMVPVAQVPEGKTELTPEITFGKTPDGKAMRFVHKDTYDEIDGTYETITAYLDAKDVEAKDAFIEEYVSEMTNATDPNLEINIYVQPKD